jgi:hypothetical protein
MDERIPSEADWRSEPWDLDISCAHKHFAGKTFEEAIELFKENSLRYEEDVMFMPRACFFFYAKAYMCYLMSDASKGDSDGASCFFGLVEVRSKEVSSNESFAASIVGCLGHLAIRQEWYEAETWIYGCFAMRAQQALEKLLSERSGT